MTRFLAGCSCRLASSLTALLEEYAVKGVEAGPSKGFLHLYETEWRVSRYPHPIAITPTPMLLHTGQCRYTHKSSQAHASGMAPLLAASSVQLKQVNLRGIIARELRQLHRCPLYLHRTPQPLSRVGLILSRTLDLPRRSQDED